MRYPDRYVIKGGARVRVPDEEFHLLVQEYNEKMGFKKPRFLIDDLEPGQVYSVQYGQAPVQLTFPVDPKASPPSNSERPGYYNLGKGSEDEMVDKRYLEPEPGEPKPPPYQADLDKLIGMAGPKAEVMRLANLATMAQKRRLAGLPTLSSSFHMSFTGNPGTGKTTFARIVAKVLHHHGILPKEGVVEVDRSSLIGQYQGHSEAAIKAKLQEALGRVLFIDEFYALAVEHKGGTDFGKMVIDVLVKFMEDNRDNISIIVAGYTEPMQKAIASNPGLKSRFTRTIHFPDYSAEELLEIFDNMVIEKKFTLTDDAYPAVGRVVKAHYANRGEDFGNARDMRTLFERVTDVQANRVISDNTSITVITAPDIREAAALCGMQ